MRISVRLKISTVFTVDDTGYTSKMTLPEIEKWAANHARCLTVYIKEGSLDSKPVRNTTIVIERIEFTPEGDEGQVR